MLLYYAILNVCESHTCNACACATRGRVCACVCLRVCVCLRAVPFPASREPHSSTDVSVPIVRVSQASVTGDPSRPHYGLTDPSGIG